MKPHSSVLEISNSVSKVYSKNKCPINFSSISFAVVSVVKLGSQKLVHNIFRFHLTEMVL